MIILLENYEYHLTIIDINKIESYKIILYKQVV